MSIIDNPLITNIGIILGVIFFVWRYFMVDRGVIGSYKEAAEAYGVRILALESENTTLKAENAAQKLQIEEMKRRLLVLETTVTGKDTLVEIQKTLMPVPAFFAPGGTLEVIMKDNHAIKNLLEDIKGHVSTPPA